MKLSVLPLNYTLFFYMIIIVQLYSFHFYMIIEEQLYSFLNDNSSACRLAGWLATQKTEIRAKSAPLACVPPTQARKRYISETTIHLIKNILFCSPPPSHPQNPRKSAGVWFFQNAGGGASLRGEKKSKV